MESIRVGIREFRENLARYLEAEAPVTITRHGTTIGVYVPTRPRPSRADLEALQTAGEKLDAMIAAASASEDELIADFKRSREREKQLEKA